MPNPPSMPYELKGSLYPMTALRLNSTDAGFVGDTLARQVKKTPDFLGQAPIIIDVGNDEADFIHMGRNHYLAPVFTLFKGNYISHIVYGNLIN